MLHAPDYLEEREGIWHFRPRGPCSLVEGVDLVTNAIAYCKNHGIHKLLVNVTELTGVSNPSDIDRFLIAEEWGQAAGDKVRMALVSRPEHFQPRKMGLGVAATFGAVFEVYTSELEALRWLSALDSPPSR